MPPAALTTTHESDRREKAANRAAFAACLLLPLALLHARAVAEMLIAGIDILFLLRTALPRKTAWLQQPFMVAALAWWIWLSLCSALGTGGLLLGLLAIRLPVLAMALGTWVLEGGARQGGAYQAAARRHAVWVVLAAAFCWIGLQAWQQYLLGTNLFGQPRWPDGALTGPFAKPRAGPAFILLFFPALLPGLARMAARPALRARVAAGALAVLAALTMVLIGQRMPTVLMLLGLVTSALLLPRLRVALLCAGAAGAALVAALPWVSPAAAAKLVQQTTGQMAHFGQSDYGLIFTRAVTVGELHPWLGLGFDGFRRGCHAFWAMHGISWLGIPTANLNGGLSACNIHPHNYYLEALDDAGLPGLALFSLMAGAALARLGGGVRGGLPALRAGLLVGAVVALWPIASTSAFTSMPNGGWVFLLLGLGFAAGGVGLPATGEASPSAGNNGRRTPFERPDNVEKPMSDETTADHGFIRAWAEARDGRPAVLESRTSPAGNPLLRFDFGTPEPGLREVAWDEFFTIFEGEKLALEFREFPGQLSRFYKLVQRLGE